MQAATLARDLYDYERKEEVLEAPIYPGISTAEHAGADRRGRGLMVARSYVISTRALAQIVL